jgi:hypothetical protein
MIRNTVFAEALVQATAKALNTHGDAASWVARCVVDRVTYTKTGTIRENDVKVQARYKTRQAIAAQCGVLV